MSAPNPDTTPPPSPVSTEKTGRWSILLSLLGVFLSLIGLILIWQIQGRLGNTEKDMAERHQKSYLEAQEAIKSARLSEDTTRATAAKVALLEAKIIEVAAQRSQVDELVQSLSRGRDENLLADIETALRVAQQYSELTGSTEPLINTLRQIDDRLHRQNQSRYDRLRKAIATDLEQIRNNAGADMASLSGRLDGLARDMDVWPLLMPTTLAHVITPARTKPAAASESKRWWDSSLTWAGQIWAEVAAQMHSLIRVSQISQPEAALISPEQSYYLRENLKLRLLNARIALQTRQFDLLQSDLDSIESLINRYFDTQNESIKKAFAALQAVKKEAQSSPSPNPNETLSTLSSMNLVR